MGPQGSASLWAYQGPLISWMRWSITLSLCSFSQTGSATAFSTSCRAACQLLNEIWIVTVLRAASEAPKFACRLGKFPLL